MAVKNIQAQTLYLTDMVQRANRYYRAGKEPVELQTLWSANSDYDHERPGEVRFLYPMYTMTGPGTAVVAVERPVACAGEVSVRVRTHTTTGAAGLEEGVHFNRVDEVITFADGEVSVKFLEVEVTALPKVGFHWLRVSLSEVTGGAELRQAESFKIVIDDGVRNPAGTVVSAGLQDAADAANPGDLFYVSGEHVQQVRKVGEQHGGLILLRAGSIDAPVIWLTDPQNAGSITPQYSLSTDDNSTCCVIYCRADYNWIRGIECHSSLYCGLFTWGDDDDGYVQGLVVDSCYFHDIGNPPNGISDFRRPTDPAGDNSQADIRTENLGAIRPDHTIEALIHNTRITRVYNAKTGFTSNVVDSEPFGLHAGVHGFQPQSLRIFGCDISNVGKAVFSKQPSNSFNRGHWIQYCKFSNVGEVCFANFVAGSGNHGSRDVYFDHNLMILTAHDSNWCEAIWQNQESTLEQSSRMYAYNNTQIGGSRFMETSGMVDICIFNNIGMNMANVFSIEGRDGPTEDRVEYFDFNIWVNISGSLFVTSRYDGANRTDYTSMAQWRTAYDDGDDQLERDVGAGSTEIAPTFTDSANDDYSSNTLGVNAGRFGQGVGIGSTLVGLGYE